MACCWGSAAVEGFQSLQDRGVGMVEEDLERMGGEIGEVVAGELFESHREVLGGSLHRFGVVVGFELVFAGEHAEGDGNEAGDGLEENEEDDQSDIDGDLFHLEGAEEGAREGGVG